MSLSSTSGLLPTSTSCVQKRPRVFVPGVITGSPISSKLEQKVSAPSAGDDATSNQYSRVTPPWRPDLGGGGVPPNEILIRGGSVIVDPFGEVLAGPVFDEDAVLVAEIDPGAVIRGRFDLDVSGHYARPDVFELRVLRPVVDETPPVAGE